MSKSELAEGAAKAFLEEQKRLEESKAKRKAESEAFGEHVRLAYKVTYKALILLGHTGVRSIQRVGEQGRDNSQVVKTVREEGNVVGIGSLDTEGLSLFGFAQVKVVKRKKLGEYQPEERNRRFRKDTPVSVFVPVDAEPEVLGVGLDLFTSNKDDANGELLRVEQLAAGKFVTLSTIGQESSYKPSLDEFAKHHPWDTHNSKLPHNAYINVASAEKWSMPKLNARLDLVLEAHGVTVEPVVPTVE